MMILFEGAGNGSLPEINEPDGKRFPKLIRAIVVDTLGDEEDDETKEAWADCFNKKTE